MFGDMNWCDVNSDDELGLEGIPELPPLMPLLDVASAPVTPEKSGAQEEDGSTTSTGGSAVEDNDTSRLDEIRNAPVKSSSRFRFEKDDDVSPGRSSPSNAPKVCFIGNFPPTATLEDFREFIDLKGINVTEIRVGPRKKQNSNGFGYVDLASDEDFEKLLADDGCTYLGRKIRIDTATPHKKTKPSFVRKNNGSMNSRKSAHQPFFGKMRHNAMRGRDLRLSRAHSAPSSNMQAQGGRANRFFLNRRNMKTGTRNFAKRSPKNRSRKNVRDPFGGARQWRLREERSTKFNRDRS